MSDKGSEPPTSPAPSEKAQSPTPSVKSAKKSPRGRPAKSPRGPPQPTPEEIAQKEKSFLLDCIAVDTISKDFSHCQPKLGPAIPAYNSQNDKHVKLYFSREQVDETLRKTQQVIGIKRTNLKMRVFKIVIVNKLLVTIIVTVRRVAHGGIMTLAGALQLF